MLIISWNEVWAREGSKAMNNTEMWLTEKGENEAKGRVWKSG